MMCNSGLKTDEESMVNYSDMTDFEINRRVAQCMGLAIAFKQPFGDAGLPEVRLEAGQGGYFNPCNSWFDAGPIIKSSSISLIFEAGDDPCALGGVTTGQCFEVNFTHCFQGPNTLRAAMIVYLMMYDKGEIYE